MLTMDKLIMVKKWAYTIKQIFDESGLIFVWENK
jgi:hypothetical protein